MRSFVRRRPDLDLVPDPVDSLIATILSQNTSDINSQRAYQSLRSRYENWRDVLLADPLELEQVIRQGGLARQKSQTILGALRQIEQEFGSLELSSLQSMGTDDLLSMFTYIKGVGLKTAACVLMFSLGRDLCAVDTHIHRIVNRLGLVRTSTPENTFHELRGLLPKGRARIAHVDLILFGRRICKAVNPHCFECPLYDLCDWVEKEKHADARKAGPRSSSGDLLLTEIIKRKQSHT